MSAKYTSAVCTGWMARFRTRKYALVVSDAFRRYPMKATPWSVLSLLSLLNTRLELCLLQLCEGSWSFPSTTTSWFNAGRSCLLSFVFCMAMICISRGKGWALWAVANHLQRYSPSVRRFRLLLCSLRCWIALSMIFKARFLLKFALFSRAYKQTKGVKCY